MKNTVKYLFVALLLAVAMGCGKKKSGGSGGDPGSPFNPFDPWEVPPITDPENPVDPDNGGAAADFIPVSKSRFDEYLGFTSNAPSDYKVVVTLTQYGSLDSNETGMDYLYGGYVKINFKDNGVAYSDVFTSLVNPAGTVQTNYKNNFYNIVTKDFPELKGDMGYHGFFEDARVQQYIGAPFPVFGGAIILVIDKTNDMGDGQGPTSASGSVWFKNYMAPISPTSCWYVTAGPRDCRTWISGSKVNPKKSIYPGSEYKKLGSFKNLDITKAFN